MFYRLSEGTRYALAAVDCSSKGGSCIRNSAHSGSFCSTEVLE